MFYFGYPAFVRKLNHFLAFFQKAYPVSSVPLLKVKDITKLEPPEDSAAKEYIETNYDFIYKESEKTQLISKSVWFELKYYEKYSDFYEYCIPTKQYQSIVSIIWED